MSDSTFLVQRFSVYGVVARSSEGGYVKIADHAAVVSDLKQELARMTEMRADVQKEARIAEEQVAIALEKAAEQGRHACEMFDEARRQQEAAIQLRRLSTWTLIDEKHRPHIGDEVLKRVPTEPIARLSVCSVSSNLEASYSARQWNVMGFTHYRPLNAPEGLI